MAKTVLITGATGFIGQKLGVALASRGYTLRALVRDVKRTQGTLAFPAEVFAWQEDYKVPFNALADCDAVIHLAGEPIAEGRWTAAKKRRILRSREQSSLALLKAMNQLTSPPAVYLQSSAIGFYGDRGNEALVEESPGGEGFLAEICKRWETPYASLLPRDTRGVVLRIGMVLGWEGGALPTLNELYASHLGAELGTGQQWVSWIHIDDLVRLFIFLLENPETQGIFNGVSPHPVPFAMFNQLLGQYTGSHSNKRIPGWVLRQILGEKAAMLLDSQKVLPEKSLNLGFSFHFSTQESALQNLYGALSTPGSRILRTQQWLAKPIEEVWDFFSSEINLETITPPSLRFKVLGKSTGQVQAGTTIHYALKIRGIPCEWRSQISIWQAPTGFTDEQVRGPYRLWLHKHDFKVLAGGVLMTDEVEYQLPLPRVMHGLIAPLIRKELEGIFQFRRQSIAGIFSRQGTNA